MTEVSITPAQADMVLQRHKEMKEASTFLESALSRYAYARRDLHSALSVLLGGVEFSNVEIEGTTLFVEVSDASDVQPLESGEEK